MMKFLAEAWIFFFCASIVAGIIRLVFEKRLSTELNNRMKLAIDFIGKWLFYAVVFFLIAATAEQLLSGRSAPSSDDTSEPGLYHGRCGPAAC